MPKEGKSVTFSQLNKLQTGPKADRFRTASKADKAKLKKEEIKAAAEKKYDEYIKKHTGKSSGNLEKEVAMLSKNLNKK